MAREYKDSGIAWIGEIPSHWRISKIKNETFILDYLRQPISAENRNNTLGLYDYYGASGVIDKIDDYNVDDKVLLIGEDGANLVLRNLPLIYKAEGRFWVNNHAHILKVKDDNYYEYMYYMLEAGDYYLYITGSAQPKLSQDNMKNFLIPIPPLSEQQAIADYLDKKCGEIDELISLQEKIIEELKAYKQSVITEAVTKGLNPDVPMKDSGIEWIGEIPEGWRISQLKKHLTFQNGQDYKQIEASEYDGFPVYGSGGIFAYAERYIYEGESVLFGRKGTINKPLYVNGKFWTVDTMYYTIPQAGRCCKYMYYLATILPYEKYSTTTALPSMTQTILGNLIVAIPTYAEQQAIADYLDNKCSEIGSLIALKQKKIEELKDYKKSIIYECVTGKIEIV